MYEINRAKINSPAQNNGEIMSLEHPSCQEEENYIRQNYSQQASWCGRCDEEDEEAPEEIMLSRGLNRTTGEGMPF